VLESQNFLDVHPVFATVRRISDEDVRVRYCCPSLLIMRGKTNAEWEHVVPYN
jgi:alkylated DNA repair dioxygenase AlkB